MDSALESPFVIPHEDVEALEGSEGFRLLRGYLRGLEGFCTSHATASSEAQSTWLFHRDILHALVMPVVELFKRASTLAEAALCTKKSEDLELAFSGEARSAFLWLQCFVSEEEDWVRTRGCPACVTIATLSTESHIRLTIAASLLSTLTITTPSSEHPPSPPTSATTTTTNPSLPALPHIIPALREALASDPFWGPDYWPYLFSRASQLSTGIQALITSLVDLESLVASPSPTTAVSGKRSPTAPVTQLHGEKGEEKGLKLRKSKLAKRQLRMKAEEVSLMRRCALQCWARAVVPREIRAEVLGLGMGREGRVRSLTCP
ncbi:hypothetical protein CC80DRAFT_424259 [Byssothecium circinans]|uniref:Uncharacterized protein n=1 Tax=Byssothecium circinans TaxID=147558 RepID=A0A6A5TFA3_9PLEO|nr:hypothetical protein CC80DRAFT_424259 [Byssothecium circinans]